MADREWAPRAKDELDTLKTPDAFKVPVWIAVVPSKMVTGPVGVVGDGEGSETVTLRVTASPSGALVLVAPPAVLMSLT